MKKQRPHTAKRNAAHTRAKLRRRSTSATQPVSADASSVVSSRAWSWHLGAGVAAAGPTQRPHGPPPSAKGRQARAAKGAPTQVKIVATKHAAPGKLLPALSERLSRAGEPVQTPLGLTVWARQRWAAQWRADRFAASALLLPALMTAALLAVTPRLKTPLEEAHAWFIAGEAVTAVAAHRPVRPAVGVRFGASKLTPQSTASEVVQSRIVQVHAARSSAVLPLTVATALPETTVVEGAPFVREPERLAFEMSAAVHDLDAVMVALMQDAARARARIGPPFMRPAEGATPSVPLAVHDLAAAVARLAEGVVAARPPFTRQAEGSIASMPEQAPEPEKVTADAPVVAALALPESVPALAEAQICRAGPDLVAVKGSAGRSTIAARFDPAWRDDPVRFGLALAAAAKAQTNDLVIYNASYMSMAYPRGDVPMQFGVCTDVVIRAYRALDIDLQELVHLSRPGPSDANIDHRRTELLRRFFATYGEPLSISPYIEDYLPGDIVTYYRPQNKSSTAHIAMVTDVVAVTGRPMIAHNRGWGVQLEDALFVDQMTGHYRFRGLKPVVPPLSDAMMIAGAAVRQSTAGLVATAAGEAMPLSTRLSARERPSKSAVATRMAGIRALSRAAMPGVGPRMGLGIGPPAPAGRCEVTGARLCRPGAG